MRRRMRQEWQVLNYAYWVTPTAELPQAVWDTTRAMQAAWNEMVTLRDEILPQWMERRETLNSEEKRAFWDAFRAQCRECVAGLDWENAEALLDRFLTAHQKAIRDSKTRAQNGQGFAQVRMKRRLEQVWLVHRYTGGGIPGERIAGSRSHRFSIQEFPAAEAFVNNLRASRRARYVEGTFGVGESVIRFRCNLHRPLPEDAIVKRVMWAGTYDRFEREWRWQIVLTVEVPPTERRRAGRRAGLDLGWRKFTEYLRIGYVMTEEGTRYELRLPLDLSNAVTRRRGFPASFQELDERKSEIGLLLEATKEQIRPFMEDARGLPQMRQGGLARLLRELQATTPEHPAIPILTEWKVKNDRQQRWVNAHERRMVARRTWLYRNLAAWLAVNFDEIAWEGDLDIKGMAEEEEKDEPLQRADHWRQRAAVGALRLLLKEACAKRGTRLVGLRAAYSTVTCVVCGGEAEAGAALELVCPNGHKWDQDVNAAANLVQAAFANAENSTAESDLREIVIPQELQRTVVAVA